tara:strand:- start:3895 stop:4968 length:1074 start_codon:yes stop_codon:yes gene_type:complete
MTGDDELYNLLCEKFNKYDKDIFDLVWKIHQLTENREDGFLIDVDVVYNIIGFNRRSDIITLLNNINSLQEGVNYLKKIIPISSDEKKQRKVTHKMEYLLNLNAFTILCSNAKTKKAEITYEYYNKMKHYIMNYYISKKINTNINNNIIYSEFVYVLSSDKKNIYKIGRTTRDVNLRKKELQTSNINNILIKHTFNCYDSNLLEKLMHFALSRNRVSKQEYFNVNLEHIKLIGNTINNILNTFLFLNENMDENEIINTLKKNMVIHETKTEPLFIKDKSEFIYVLNNKNLIKEEDIIMIKNINYINFYTLFDIMKYKYKYKKTLREDLEKYDIRTTKKNNIEYVNYDLLILVVEHDI